MTYLDEDFEPRDTEEISGNTKEDEEDEEDRDTEESLDDYESRWGPPVDPASVVRVAIDWVELEGALENNSPELHSFLNKGTGDVIRIFRGSENSEVRLREAETDPDFVYIEPISSREQYRWMEEFIEITEESNLKDKLNIAIDGKGAFRRFKDVLVGYPADRERWFAMRSVRLRNHMTEWLTVKGVEPINTPVWDDETHTPAEDGDDVSGDEKARDAGTDLRQIAHDLVDMVPSRELPTAVAFLEFLRSRRGVRRQRYG